MRRKPLLTIATLCAIPCAAMAEPPEPRVELFVRASLNDVIHLPFLPHPATVSVDFQNVHTTGNWPDEVGSRRDLQAVAVAETHGGSSPQAIATASSSLTTQFAPEGRGGSGSAAAAWARLDYTVAITPTQAIPDDIPQAIPVKAHWHASAELTGDIDASESSSFLQGNRGLINISIGTIFWLSEMISPTNPSYNNSGIVELELYPDPSSFIWVGLRAEAGAWTVHDDVDLSPGRSTSIVSQVVADPWFEFDQARFDQMAHDLGFDTFVLSDYFAFEYHPSIIPEPGALVIVGFGMMALGKRRR